MKWDPSRCILYPNAIRIIQHGCLQCFEGELPDLTRVDQYTGIFLTGSHCSANGPEPWIAAAADWLSHFAHLQTTCKVLAICFGCQASSQALLIIIAQKQYLYAVVTSFITYNC